MQGERMGSQLVHLLWGVRLCYFICKKLYLRAPRGGHDYRMRIMILVETVHLCRAIILLSYVSAVP